MNHESMIEHLAGLDLQARYPVWIISHQRAGSAPTLDGISASWVRTDDVHVLVRQSQLADYKAAYPRLQLHAYPDENIPNVGTTRWAAADLAYALGDDVIVMMDDDVLKLDFLYQGAHKSGVNAGAECSSASGKADRAQLPNLDELVVTAFASTAREVFAAEPGAVLGGMNKRHMSFSPKNHRTHYTVNGGATARQVYAWHLARMDQAGVALNTQLFGRHGDDIGLTAEVLAAGLDCFTTPSFVFDHWPEEININRSTLRNAANAAGLHAAEYKALMQYPIRDYLRVKRDIVGNYQWGDVDWQRLAKLRGQPTRHVGWDPALPPGGPFGKAQVDAVLSALL